MAMYVNVCAAVAFDNSFQGSQPLGFYLHKLAAFEAIRHTTFIHNSGAKF